jgi:hypothetical protein
MYDSIGAETYMEKLYWNISTRNMIWCELDSSGSGYKPVQDTCEYANGSSGYFITELF